MSDYVNRKSQRVLKAHGVISHTPSRLPAVVSFLLTGALFTAALLWTLSQAHTAERGDCQYLSVRYVPLLSARQGI
jgi:hypothetical protein